MIRYFAYGSNMNLRHLREYLVQHGRDPRGIHGPRRAFLHDWRFRTNYARSSGIGAANIELWEGGRVEGLLMSVTPEAFRCINRKEAAGVRYQPLAVYVTVPKERCGMVAMAFTVCDEYRLPFDIRVDERYRSLILEAAERWRFSQAYQATLRRILRAARRSALEVCE